MLGLQAFPEVLGGFAVGPSQGKLCYLNPTKSMQNNGLLSYIYGLWAVVLPTFGVQAGGIQACLASHGDPKLVKR